MAITPLNVFRAVRFEVTTSTVGIYTVVAGGTGESIFQPEWTPAGDLVRTLKNAGGTGVLEWDVRNRGGEEVSSGTYIYRVERNNGDSMYGRLTIIR